MNNQLFDEVARCIDAGAAPGCAIVLLPPDADRIERFAYGHFAGTESPAVSTNTIYDVASISKLFTTALILRLHEQHRLSVNDRCGVYLPNFQNSTLQIVDLLAHRVGFGIALSEYRSKFADGKSLRQALLQLETPTKAAATVTYANTQFFYLGIIIERVTGRSLHDEIMALCEDLSLKHTFTGQDVAKLDIVTPPTENLGTEIVQGVTHDETARMLGGLAGHAGVFSSAEDLALFGKAWLNGHIVSQEIMRELVFKNYNPSGAYPQALGWWMRLTGPNDIAVSMPNLYSHNGFTGPLLAISPKTSKVCAFTCNRTMYGRDNKKQRYIWQLLANWVQS